MNADIRPYEPGDLDSLYDVCVRTAAKGDDLSGELDDPGLPGHLYAAPYAVFEPELVFVAADTDGVGGYILGTSDTAAFQARLEAEWLPSLRSRYPEGTGDGVDGDLIRLLHNPPRNHPEIVATHPAHLHIDLLPRLQGQGIGRRLIDRFCTEVQRRGAAGVHFGVNPANHRALGFYTHLGFETLRVDPLAVILGRRFRE